MILDDIIKTKKQEVGKLREAFRGKDLEALAGELPPSRDLLGALRMSRPALIAEVKKASPSAGVIRQDYDPAVLAKAYESSGADAISVLTDANYFKGSAGDLKSVRGSVEVPVLRKDFIIDGIQVFESRLMGADAVLLIVRIMDDKLLKKLLMLVRRLGMQALVEAHDEAEAKRATLAGADIIGINNRDLDSLAVDLATTKKVLDAVPDLKTRTVVSESGIKSSADVEMLLGLGVKAVLVGESILASGDIFGKIKELKLKS